MSDTIPGLQPAEFSAVSGASADTGMGEAGSTTKGRALEEAVEYVLGDCFFAVGQTIGMRMTVDYEAVVWWHDHFRAKFLAAMQRQGNRWLQDRRECDSRWAGCWRSVLCDMPLAGHRSTSRPPVVLRQMLNGIANSMPSVRYKLVASTSSPSRV